MTWANIAKNWKTSGAGLVAALSIIAGLFFPDKQELIAKIATAITALALALFALSSKDNDVTGTAANPRAVIAGGEVALPTPAAITEAAPRAAAEAATIK
jgi:hypothetical protein